MLRLARARALHTPPAPARPLRIFALPLAPTPSAPTRRTPLLYWHISQRAPPAADADADAASTALNVREPASWVPYGINKASAFWLSWGDPPGDRQGGKVAWSERVKGWKYWV